MIHLLTVSGSLRAGSSNSTLLAAAGRTAPEGVVVASYAGLGDLPAFSPDLDEGSLIPPAVVERRSALARADAVLFSSPEYAHGVPGAFKNALDWVVGSGDAEVLLADPGVSAVLRSAVAALLGG